MSIVKYRPTLTADEISDIISALESHNPASSALATLKVYAFKQSLGLVKPATVSNKVVETEEQKQERIKKELADAAAFFAKTSAISSDSL